MCRNVFPDEKFLEYDSLLVKLKFIINKPLGTAAVALLILFFFERNNNKNKNNNDNNDDT